MPGGEYDIVRPEGEWPDLMTGPEVAKLFRVDPKTVSRWGKTGKLTALRTPGGHLRYHRSEVLMFLARGMRRGS